MFNRREKRERDILHETHSTAGGECSAKISAHAARKRQSPHAISKVSCSRETHSCSSRDTAAGTPPVPTSHRQSFLLYANTQLRGQASCGDKRDRERGSEAGRRPCRAHEKVCCRRVREREREREMETAAGCMAKRCFHHPHAPRMAKRLSFFSPKSSK